MSDRAEPTSGDPWELPQYARLRRRLTQHFAACAPMARVLCGPDEPPVEAQPPAATPTLRPPRPKAWSDTGSSPSTSSEAPPVDDPSAVGTQQTSASARRPTLRQSAGDVAQIEARPQTERPLRRVRDDRAAPVGEAGTAEVTPDAQSDRRFAERKQSRTSAVIVNPNGDRVKCTVQDISSSGARIALPVDASSMSRAGDYVAPRFRLTMPIENVSFEAEIAWRSGNRLGARFVSPAQIEQPKLRRKVAAQPEKPDLKSIATALFRR